MKMLKFIFTFLLILVISILFSQTHISGTIQNNTTWDIGGSPYIVDNDVTVPNGVTLTIQPGVIVKFNDYWDGIWVKGIMNAIGTQTNKIVFTSLLDDSRGGDTNGDGSASEPGPGQWSTIVYEKGSSGILKYCDVIYGGGEYTANIHINDNGVKIDNCNISYSEERGIWIGNASPDIINNTFTENGGEGIRIEGFDSIKTFSLTNNQFINNAWAVYANLSEETNDIVLTGNQSRGSNSEGFGRNGFGLSGTISGKVSYTGQRNFPYIIWEDVLVREKASLEISAGTTVKFNDYWDGINIFGTFKVLGQKDNPIVFAPVAIDCIGNDTNGPVDTTMVTSGQWSGIYFDKLSSGNILKNVILTSGGGEGSAMISINTDNVLIDSCQVFNSNYYGIYVNGSSPEIKNSIISDNIIGILTTSGSAPVIENNSFNKNQNFGIQNWDASILVNAKNNYWGSSTGPLAPGNSEGLGDPVSDFVEFMPWLDKAPFNLTGNLPDFDFVINGNKVSFLNKSTSTGTFIWDMGDMTNDIVNNPYHVYEKPGDYQVCLASLGSDCFPSESVCKKISIKGISSFLPLEAGNIGLVTFNIAAGGVNNKTRFAIRDNTNTIIMADSVYFYSNGTAKAIFDLSGISTGIKDLIIIYEDGTMLAADSKLNVVNGYEAEPELEIIARSAALINVWTNYEVKIINPGNVDLIGVPVWIAYSNIPGLEAEFKNVVFTPSPYSINQGRDSSFYFNSGVDIFVDVDSIFGEAHASRVYPLYIPLIPAGQSVSLKMKIKSPEDFVFQAWINDPYFSNDLTRGSGFNGRLIGCLTSIFIDKLITITPGVDCANTIIKSIYKPLSGLQSNSPKFLVMPSVWDFVSIGLDCGKSMFASVKMAYEITKLVVNFRNDIAAIRDCQKNFDPKRKKRKPVNIVQSFDPNEKEGPSGYGYENYLTYQDKITYTIFFENDPDSAQVPAHTVKIVDSLDMSVFDINSFEVNGVSIGDSLYAGLPGAKTLAANINLSDLNVDARIVVQVDTVSGILECKFLSLDPVSGNEIEYPYSGFLPPNVNKPQGEGSISFTIGLKKNISDGMIVKNKALIYFDANKPIETNTFINTFDLSSPESRIVSVKSLNNGKEIINIEGSDNLSGIDYFELWYSENDAPYKIFSILRGAFVDTLEGTIGNNYKLYSVAVDNVGNRELEPSVADIKFTLTSTDDLVNNAIWQVYPNPAFDYIIFKISLKNSENISVDIYDKLGKNVKSIFSGYHYSGLYQKQTNVDDLLPGLYYIKCRIGEYMMMKKLVIQ